MPGSHTVRGKVLNHERPVAGMALELCTAHRRSIKDVTPCWDEPTRRTARTGADGSFVFDHVVDGDLEIVMLELPFYNACCSRSGCTEIATSARDA